MQGQGQKQVSVGEVDTNQANTQSVKLEGDTIKTYAFAPPALNAEKGTSPLNAYSIFGGIGISNTEEYQVCIEKIAVIERMGALHYLSKEEARKEAREAFKQLKGATKTKRVLGILWKTRGRHLLNGFGLLATDSWISNNSKTSNVKTKTIDKDLSSGNKGYIN